MYGAAAFGKGKLRERTCRFRKKTSAFAMPRPWISTNLAISADGKISSVQNRPSNWTSAADHARLLMLREKADALIVGRGTLEADRMTMRVPGKNIQPLRCIVSQSGDIAPDHPLFHSDGGAVHVLVTGNAAHPGIAGATTHHGTLAGFLETLACELGVKYLHCEGGGALIRSLAEMDVIDEFHLTLAGHTLFGGAMAPTATGIPAEFLPQSRVFTLHEFHAEADECFLSYRR
jgi:2,5-diamino-6-(ribosylamino)-4(3H)-pyrimidinone 5'-phosphate reductase